MFGIVIDMQKDFAGWLVRQIEADERTNVPYFDEREIWWVALGHNVGNEQDGRGPAFSRPVLIYKKFNRTFFLGAPLSTSAKDGKYYLPIEYSGHRSTAILSQIRALDARRLIRKYGWLDAEEYDKLRKKLLAIL